MGAQGYEQWVNQGAKTEIDRAREKALEILKTHHPEVVSEKLKEELLELIRKGS